MSSEDTKSSSSNLAVKSAIAAGGCGCLAAPAGLVVFVVGPVLILGGFAVLLLPLIILALIFSGQPLGSIDTGTELTTPEAICEQAERGRNEQAPESAAQRAQEIALGDGLGELETTRSGEEGVSRDGRTACTVPNDYYLSILEAGAVCDVIGPVTIAAQIQYESRFAADFVGPNGAEGISQLPPDKFEQFADEDGDPFNPQDSIAAQGAYLCALAEEADELLDQGQVTGNVLDLTLAAYDVGMDAVREAGGVPATEESQSYVVGVRAWFASMEGLGPPPRTLPITPGLFDE
ncbi:transglycosylase SLT domain-containing protein [Streptomyces sp. NPDC017943]|uniref:transglycosylase SLT domain-containing protein n=1 Tax=Streptomyces sp. NPDC017943 TaxID=3365019 RepID=UPI0037AFF775